MVNIALKGAVAHVDCSMVNARTDHMQYDGRDQELPAIYTNGPWYRLMTYTGDSPFTDAPLTHPPTAFPWTGWNATENWAALVDDTNFGVGVYEPGVYRFIGGFAGKPGKGGPKDGPTGYIAPLHVEILDWNITYRYSYDLIVGTLDDIRSTVYRIAKRPLVPDYSFSRDRNHWRYINATDAGWPINGELAVAIGPGNPQLHGPAGFWHAVNAPVLKIEAALPQGISKIKVFWTRLDAEGFSEQRVVNVSVSGDGSFNVLNVPLAQHAEYKGVITGIRIDPFMAGGKTGTLRVKRIWFGEK